MKNIRTQRIDACPICGIEKSEFWALGQDNVFRATDQQFEYRKCSNCRTVFEADQPILEDFDLVYPASYGPHGTTKDARWIKVPDKLNSAFLKLAEKIVGNPEFVQRSKTFYKLDAGEAVLDYGCGAGKFLDRAKKYGCETVGFDFSDVALERVRSNGHVAIHASDKTWLERYRAHFTNVRMNHIIEHVADPEQTMAEILSVMAEGGQLHIATPNIEGHSAQTYKQHWWGLECPRHLVMLPPDQLAKLMENVGFESVEIIHEPITKDLARSWAFSQAKKGKIRSESVEGLAYDGLLNLSLAWQARRAVNERRGDRLHVIAKRPKSK